MALVKFSVAFGFELRINPKIEGTIKTYYTIHEEHAPKGGNRCHCESEQYAVGRVTPTGAAVPS